MAQEEDFSISRLFFTGMITAAGATLFWWLIGGSRKAPATRTRADDELDHLLLVSEAETGFSRFVKEDGAVEFSAPAHIVTATKPAT